MELSTCKSLVQASGGTIEVFSNGLNKGSTFKFAMQMKTRKNNKKGKRRKPSLNSMANIGIGSMLDMSERALITPNKRPKKRKNRSKKKLAKTL